MTTREQPEELLKDIIAESITLGGKVVVALGELDEQRAEKMAKEIQRKREALISLIQSERKEAVEAVLERLGKKFLETDEQCIANPELETFYHTELDQVAQEVTNG